MTFRLGKCFLAFADIFARILLNFALFAGCADEWNPEDKSLDNRAPIGGEIVSSRVNGDNNNPPADLGDDSPFGGGYPIAPPDDSPNTPPPF